MHSAELARLARVTVRALRHYHQVGVLAEPERRSNGYRDYTVHDLVRVLRIKRLAALGIPLERMPSLLGDASGEDDEAGEGVAGLLDELDAELAMQIDRLVRQREVVARLRDHGAAPDLPPELAPFMAVLAAGASPDVARFDRDQSVLLAHLVGEEGMSHLARFYERLSDPAIAPTVAAVTERFARLGPDSSQSEVDELVECYVSTLGEAVEDFARAEPPIDLDHAGELFDDHASTLLNERQRATLDAITERLSPRP